MKQYFLTIMASCAVIILTACGVKSGNAEALTENTDAIVSVDSILALPDSYLGQTLTIEGVCSHLCKHGGRKAFVLGTDENTMLRCDATDEMGGRFPEEAIHQVLRVTGILEETRVDSAAVTEMERLHQEAQWAREAELDDANWESDNGNNQLAGCETERKATGQSELTTFSEQMDDYRQRIAKRAAEYGKPYLSFYYLKATAYEIDGQ